MFDRWTLESCFSERFLVTTWSRASESQRSQALPASEALWKARDLLEQASRYDLCDMFRASNTSTDLTQLSDRDLARVVEREIKSGNLLVVPIPEYRFEGALRLPFVEALRTKPAERIREPEEELVEVALDGSVLGALGDAEVSVKYADGTQESLAADRSGVVRLKKGHGDHADIQLAAEVGGHKVRVFIELQAADSSQGAWQRLVNLGYAVEPYPGATPPSEERLGAMLVEFQAEHGIAPTGELDSETSSALARAYGAGDPWKNRQRTMLADANDTSTSDNPKELIA